MTENTFSSCEEHSLEERSKVGKRKIIEAQKGKKTEVQSWERRQEERVEGWLTWH